MSLESEIKIEIGYTEEKSPKCSECEFYSLVEHDFMDRAWDNVCNLVKIKRINVNPDGRCNKFQKK